MSFDRNDVTNPFEVLGIDESASEQDIKRAYFQLVRQFSPEKHGEQFKQIRQAYDLLKDPSRRLEAEVFSFIRPDLRPESVEVEPPEITFDLQVFVQWMRQRLTDLERTDFCEDFRDIL